VASLLQGLWSLVSGLWLGEFISSALLAIQRDQGPETSDQRP